MSKLGYEPNGPPTPYHAPNGESIASFWYDVGVDAPEPDLSALA